jgi:hypothetical protein
MLVRIQRPGASAVGTRAQWAKLGRKVSPDAVPVVVLRAFGPVTFLYEVSDTTGKDLPGQNANTLFAEGTVPEVVYKRISRAALKYGVQVVETDQYGEFLAGTAAGLKVSPERMPETDFHYRVKVNMNHDLATRFATLAHELAHIYCGHLGEDKKGGRWPSRAQILSMEERELEAEAVAWLVCQRNGVTSRSKDYLSSLVEKAAIDNISMYAVFDAANRVESRTPPAKKK